MTTYIKGNAKAIEGQYGEFFNISLNVEDLAQYINDKGYVNITMSKRKEVGKFWDTHSLILNEYTPWNKWDRQDEVKETNRTKQDVEESVTIEDLPF